jgi:hypothetical protein
VEVRPREALNDKAQDDDQPESRQITTPREGDHQKNVQSPCNRESGEGRSIDPAMYAATPERVSQAGETEPTCSNNQQNSELPRRETCQWARDGSRHKPHYRTTPEADDLPAAREVSRCVEAWQQSGHGEPSMHPAVLKVTIIASCEYSED